MAHHIPACDLDGLARGVPDVGADPTRGDDAADDVEPHLGDSARGHVGFAAVLYAQEFDGMRYDA